jgi:hypothetical protein
MKGRILVKKKVEVGQFIHYSMIRTLVKTGGGDDRQAIRSRKFCGFLLSDRR